METNSSNSTFLLNGTVYKTPCSVVDDHVAVKVIKLALYIAIMLLSLVGNCLVMAVVARTPKMRNVTNYLICNMAMADLFITVFNMPTYLDILVTEKYDWLGGVLGLVLCKLVLFIQGLSVAASILTLTAIAADRLVAVMLPQKKKLIPLRFVKFVILTIWLLSFLAISPLLYALTVVQVGNSGVYICDEKWSPLFDQSSAPKNYTIAIFVILYAFPLAAIGVLYTIILVKVMTTQAPGHQLADKQRREQHRKNRVLIMLVTVVCLFALCWLPMHVRSFLYFFRMDYYPCGLPRYLDFIGYFFGHANSAINFCVYSILNENYRRGFKKIYYELVSLCSITKRQNAATRRRNSSLMLSLNEHTTSSNERGKVAAVPPLEPNVKEHEKNTLV